MGLLLEIPADWRGEANAYLITLMPHTAERCPTRKRQSIITALANDESKISIAKRLHTSQHTVALVESQEWQNVADRKQRLADQAERNAYVAGEQIREALEERKYTPSALVPVYGVSIDKAALLRGDNLSTIRHIHSVDITDDDLIAFAVARSKQRSEKRAQAAVAEVPALPDVEQAPSANTRNRNP